MSEHNHHHEEDDSVCVKVAVFFIAVLVAIIAIGIFNTPGS